MDVVARLARARIGGTFNQYRHSEVLRRRLREYLDSRADAELARARAGAREQRAGEDLAGRGAARVQDASTGVACLEAEIGALS